MENQTHPNVTIHCEIAAKLNFACHQSAFPLLRGLRVKNLDEDRRLEDLTVTLSADPAFLKPKSWKIDRLAPQGSIEVRNRDVELGGSFLLDLSESVRGTVLVQVEKNGLVLAELTKNVELLAYNEWGGSGFMPELLAAFAMPNDPAIDQILHNTSLVLRKAGKKDAVDGYESNSRQRVWEIASAIYTAIANLGLTYALPPASFERDGQKIRLPSQVLENRVATCLDSTMLFASTLEKAGLNPVVVMPKGHSVVGVWLQPEELSTIVIDEAETLRKRIQLKELILIETTFLTSHPAPPFSKAVAEAESTIATEKDDEFSTAIDIKRARAHRINPLGLKSEVAPDALDKIGRPEVELTLEEAPTLPDFDQQIEEEKPETPTGRVERWQRKLLDLSARNPLLNFRSTKTSLHIICPEPGKLEDKLAEGARIAIQAMPQLSSEGQDERIHQERTGELISEEYARDALERKQVLVNLPVEQLSSRAVAIYRKTQTALQEGGANTLYLALGFLLWRRDEKDDRRFRAPLILLPVTLERKSVRSGIKILSHDDEPRLNTTLLEMLRRDFRIDIKGLEGKLPEDESGIDVEGIWNLMRREVRDVPGFEVVEEVVLGHFSFAKYLMWKDLVDRTDKLRQNAVVRHLIDTPKEVYPTEISFVDEKQLDRNYKPSDLLVPLPTDASQMAAIATADKGKDFIIIGPPGTGKSQTISNMIAHLLGKGRTVLFVSEKTAALEVVYRRLDDVGLGRFCLELHSNKARKMDVLNQLRSAWNAVNTQKAEMWEREAENLRELRDQLNQVVDSLHKRYSNGLTPHYAMGIKIRDYDLASRVTFSWPSANYHNENQLSAMRSVVEKLQIQVKAIGDVSNSPFHVVSYGEWSPQWEGKIVDLAGQVSVATTEVDRTLSAFLKTVGIESPDRTVSRLNAFADLAEVLVDSYRTQTYHVLDTDGPELLEALKDAYARLKNYANAQRALSCPFDPMAWRELDGEELASRWQEAELAWWPKSFFMRRRVLQDMRNAGAQSVPDPAVDSDILIQLRKEGQAIDRLNSKLAIFRDWQGHETDYHVVRKIYAQCMRARSVVGRLADDAHSLADVRSRVRVLMREGNDLLAQEAAVGRSSEEYRRSLTRLQSVANEFEGLAGKSVREQLADSERTLDALRESVDAISERHTELRDWCSWRRRRGEALDLELAPLLDAIEKGRVPADEIIETFEAAYCSWWSGMVIGEDKILRTFSTPEHVATIEKFRKVDEKFQEITAAYIAAKLGGELPDTEDVKHKSEWGVLRRELQKKTRHKPVRQLIEEMPGVLTELTPCLMMSPLSVAQYLPADHSLFDVVIFDEASQITVWDAIGALARAGQAIIAGDPKQMPPTNFFARSDEDPDGDVNGEGDLESILDEMLGASIPQRTLNLHYRSRRESLIAFSNSRYYNNSLVTFPAPVSPDNGVRLVRPVGFYARGSARNNEGEAKAIVEEIVRRLTHEDSLVRDLSIGVVTFNTEQQTLIENYLDNARSKNPSIEWAFSADHKTEPVFVKNLETVQGDERDVILFSITYGPDRSGHMTMNFGPLNREGGERRLNVAMTRARYEMIVFSTLHPDEIDLSRSQALAVADLKHFLEYAEKGPAALGSFVHGSVGDFESPFEIAVARALSDKGWTVHAQIGVSQYRIDLGIAHPDRPGVYLAGVECDGAMYHSSAYARERDKIRQSVLEGLGWTIIRVWSTDWWTNRTKALQDLTEELANYLEADRNNRAESQESEAGPSTASVQPTITLEDGTAPKNMPAIDSIPDPHGYSEQVSKSGYARVAKKVELAHVNSHGEMATSSEFTLNDSSLYVFTQFDDALHAPHPELFYEKRYERRMKTMIDLVVDTEGPIHAEVLVSRIARHHGFHRSGRQIRETVLNLANKRRKRTKENVGIFYWRKGTVKQRLVSPRHVGRDEEMRKVEYICRHELRKINQVLLLEGDPVALARSLGIGRVGSDIRGRIESALKK